LAGLDPSRDRINSWRAAMIALWRRVQDLAGRTLFCAIVLATMAIDRIGQGGQMVELMAEGSEIAPQQAIVRLVTILIGGSLSMIALGYRARA
jgi:hypothetical protein